MSEPTRTYSNDEIKVEWHHERCVHCENCIKGLPQVFDMQKRPWVDLSKATSDEIIKQVAECPDGALQVVDLRK